MDNYCFFLSAGGTGGHLFPAESLAHELIARGHTVHLITDHRAERFAGSFPADIHVVPSATIGSKNPVAIIRAGWKLFSGTRKARALFARYKPAAVIGFGGYPTVPPLMAATSAGIPSMVHEANAVMGRANRMLASRVKAIAGGFLSSDDATYGSRILVTGNPVRQSVIEASQTPYRKRGAADPFHLLVFGGSQGAHFFADAVPDAVAALDDELRKRLVITQQARPEDLDAVRERFATLGIDAKVAPFFDNMPELIADADLVVARSGASTVTELSVIGRPGVFVPLPHALDQDQAANAALVEANGGAEVVRQSELTTERFAEILKDAIAHPEKLETAAAAARAAGRPDATQRLADMAEALARGQKIEGID
ncbi:undecaprenyldiphospho-muramoylpentapeptide beta-N-acetylglucosaminyltransferase [Martelella mediterranea]|uniref:UDP-N-acetylglucosamine--N-acetylmuramyl-(pentapeptide) pyrophosphoryl-undecaprenol N-acetylglucosamine transferase n=1 Tax=Martelella mediterranea DSM 17316 TaxID=1122214 RepID=A0A1U9Z2H0_9HYPH|nr:undecaprenyldiphospho-muramoylpentapeptide beta-N-acetylglucosaminyltransferase [Martelella mediterranea]AQZ51802.1 UDP-N-acetylglucosamine--N-acetylmuramyl-(pentapeptide) pyrophosphoryl-undecaprenol N-acetylglucosamine transferase [Martelella mediterranea DSM 17316]